MEEHLVPFDVDDEAQRNASQSATPSATFKEYLIDVLMWSSCL
jgi:hypothetical protein